MVGTRRLASAASAAGSVPTTATRAPSRSASFSCITPASEPNPSTCAYPTFVDRKSTRLNSSHGYISYAVFCLKKKNARYELAPNAAEYDEAEVLPGDMILLLR